MLGFKSFADDTSINLDAGLNGIIGPNGSGKSNIVEAIKWVMGENSSKSLRASGMNDLIFNGSISKASKNIAAVTLNIEVISIIILIILQILRLINYIVINYKEQIYNIVVYLIVGCYNLIVASYHLVLVAFAHIVNKLEVITTQLYIKTRNTLNSPEFESSNLHILLLFSLIISLVVAYLYLTHLFIKFCNYLIKQ